MQRIYIFTLGCRVNQSESAVLQSILHEQGFRIVDQTTEADIVVINSCTVTAAGDTDAHRLARRIHRDNPMVRIAIIGCQAQVQKETLLSLPGVSWVIGTADKMKLADILKSTTSSKALVNAGPIRSKPFTLPVTKFAYKRTRANLKIQDGCNNFCAYCEVPFARGRARSRVFSNIMEEARALVDAGHREIILTGINVGLYSNSGKSLWDIVEALQHIKELDRIRLSSIEHATLPLTLTKFMFPLGKLCRSLHIPLQSGSDRILKRMGRAYSTAAYADLVNTIAKKVPGILIGSDVIVGFPGESEKDFHSTISVLTDLPINYFHVFRYSNRNKARSRLFKNHVPGSEINRRSKILRQLSLRKHTAFIKEKIGAIEQVLLEDKKGQYWTGHTDNYILIKVQSEDNLRNRILNIKATCAEGDSLIGTLF